MLIINITFMNKTNRRQLNKIFLQNFGSVFGSNPNYLNLAKLSIDQFESNLSMGTKKAIEIAKADENHMKMKILNQYPTYPFHIIWRKIDRNNNLKYLRIKESYFSPLQSDPAYSRAVLTALGYYRLFHLSADEQVLESIHQPGSEIDTSLLDELEKFAQGFFEKRGITPFEPKEEGCPVFATSKASANGAPAMGLASLRDIVSLEGTNVLTMVKDLASKAYSQTMFEDLCEIIDSSQAMARDLIDSKFNGITTKLHLLTEGGGKTRVICIPDIWTQSALKPVHEYLMKCLKKMPCDGTYSHKRLGDYVRKQTSRSGMYCFDLVSATDRFPLKIQERVLRPILGDLVHAWSSLLTERDFSYKDKKMRYAVGQPMGMLSSWAAFSITHHIIVNYCKGDKSPYAMIGDDVAISSEEGARRYKNLMEQIGVEISTRKSIHPIGFTKVAEIAKRQFITGVEISPIPPRVLIESTKNLEGFLEFLEVLSSRSDNFRSFPGFDWSESIRRLFKNNREFGSERVRCILMCPIIDIIPSLEHIKEVQALLSEVTSSPWDASISREDFIEEFECYQELEAISKLSTDPLVMISQGLSLDILESEGWVVDTPRTSKIPTTPLLESYLSYKKEVIFETLGVYGSSFMGVELGSFAVTPLQALTKILTEPDPLSPKDFLEKRKIRKKNTMDLIERYYTLTRFKSSSLDQR